jgi:dihydroorotase
VTDTVVRDREAAELVLPAVRVLGGPPLDLTVRAGRIAALTPAAGTGRHVVLPGLVDMHTHLREPGGADAETIATGTRAAAAGGFTDVFAMANTDPVCDSAERVRAVQALAAATAVVRVHPVGAITVGLAGRTLAPLAEMAAAGVTVVSDDGHCVADPGIMRSALELAARHGLTVAQHAQDPVLAGAGQVHDGPACRDTGLPPWPSAGEEVIVARDVVLAAHTGVTLHICHLSTAGSVEIVRWAKARGLPVTAEVTPHHLMLTDELAALTDPRFKVNPPLRSADDVAALRAGLIDGTIDAVATDHAPHPAAAKARRWIDAPFGMTGLETALPVVARVLRTGRDEPDWSVVAARMATSPARIGRIAARAGRPVAVGEPATFCVVDPGSPWTVDADQRFSRSGNTPFAGTAFTDRVVATFVDGRIVHGALAPLASRIPGATPR